MVSSIFFTIFLSFFLIKLIIHYASNLHLLDIPNERSTHINSVPRGAGIGFILSFLLGAFYYHQIFFIEHWYVFTSIFIVMFIGMIDDIKSVTPKAKIFIIVCAIVLLWWHGISIQTLGNYFGKEITLGWLTLPVTIIALVGFTNALNLIDGIDGLAGIISLLIIANFGYIGFRQADMLMEVVSFFTIASLIPFIIFNYNPAKVFMGDSGSLTLGFIIAILAILSLKYVHPIAALYFTALPLYDTFTVIIRRLKKGVPIFKPDQTHIHHLLLKYIGDRDSSGKRTGTRRTVWVLVAAQLIFSLIGLQVNHMISLGHEVALSALISFLIGILLVYFISTKIEEVP